MFYSEDNTEEHFAGFLSKAPDRNIDDESQHPKSKKEAMAEVVTNSKLQKVVLDVLHIVFVKTVYHMHMHVCARTHVCAHIHTHITHTHMHTHAHTPTHTCTHTHIHTHTQSTDTHRAHTHTHIHTICYFCFFSYKSRKIIC